MANQTTYPRGYRHHRTTRLQLILTGLGICVFGVAYTVCAADMLPLTGTLFGQPLSRNLTLWASLPLLLLIFPAMGEPRLAKPLRVVWVVVIMGLLVLNLSIFAFRPTAVLAPYTMQIAWTIGAAVALQGLYMAIANLRSHLILYKDHLVYRGFLLSHRVAFADIVRTSEPEFRSWFAVRLQLRNGKSLRIVNFGLFDEVFAEWIGGYPCQEDEDHDAALARLESDTRLGADPDARFKTYERHLRWLNWARWPFIIVMLWGLCAPFWDEVHTYVLMALPVVPLIVVIASPSRWSFHSGHKGYPLGIGQLAAMAPVFIFLRAFLGCNLFDWTVPAAWTAAAGALLMLIVCLIERRFPWKVLAGAYFLYCGYAWGGLLFLNDRLDRHPVRIEEAKVLAIMPDAKAPRVEVMRPNGQSIEYTGRLPGTARQGDTVCLYIHDGAFGWTWFYGAKCPDKR